ncbi:MAG: SpoIIE family protein phosphatase [Prevotella sp.]|nr:SpoIIE family protein phosphatase [Prevotella sp.]
MGKRKQLREKIGRRDITIIVAAALLMTIGAAIQYFYMRSSIIEAATESAKSDLTVTGQQIETKVTEIETAVNTMSFAILQNVTLPDAMYDITQRIMQENPIINRCVIAFSKGYYAPQKDSLYAPCTFREGEKIQRKLLTDYQQEEWYDDPAKYRKEQWSEPYIMKGESENLMVAYSYPITDRQGRFVAVLAAHVLVDSLTNMVDGIEGYPNSSAILTSRNGHQLVGTTEKTEFADAHIFKSTVGKVGWELSIICPDKDIDQKTKTARYTVFAMHLLGLLLLAFIVFNTILKLRRLHKTTGERDRMGGELNKAKAVQSTMLSSVAETFPQDKRTDCFAKTINASEVGGDFYDCFIDHDHLYFCIGDVAGKGVPAALMMSMAHSAFRVSAKHHQDSASIFTEINKLICKMNDGVTTIKMTGGILDLNTGELHYCNAGMHCPLLLHDGQISEIGDASQYRIGNSPSTIFEERQMTIKDGSTLFLYTDGLTEAENYQHEQWGTKRLNTLLAASQQKKAKELLERIEKSVRDYAGTTSLPDDLTMLAIRFTQS